MNLTVNGKVKLKALPVLEQVMTFSEHLEPCLQTANGGRKPEKMSKQHGSQINKMLAVIDPKEIWRHYLTGNSSVTHS